MATPTLVAEYKTSSNWTATTATQTASATWSSGDVLLFVAIANGSSPTIGTPTVSGLTFSSVASYSGNGGVHVYTATAVASSSGTVSATRSGNSEPWGFWVGRYSGSAGVGAYAAGNGSGAPSHSLTTTADNSAVVEGIVDWNEAWTPTTGTWLTVNSVAGSDILVYTLPSNVYVRLGRWADAGTAGAKTVGMSSPTGQSWRAIAVEIKGTTGTSNTGALAGPLPKLTGIIAGGSTNSGTLSSTPPRTTSTLTGTSSNPATLTATVPGLTASITGQHHNPGALTGTLPKLTGTLTGESTNPAALTASLPVITGTLTGTAVNPGTLASTLPLLTAQLADQAVNAGTLNGTLPRVTGTLNGSSL